VNSKQRKTLASIFRDPVSSTVAWADVESLLVAIGCEVIEGSGSRVKFQRNGDVFMAHRPHPRKECKPYQVREVRDFLTDIGVIP
jgi:hypothetical protein